MLLFGLIVMQILAFGIVIYVLKKLMVGDTDSAVNRLNESYVEINKKKEELVQKIQQIESEYQKRKEEADKIAAEIKDRTEKDANEKREAVLKKAREDAERTVAEAVTMKEKMREDIRKEEQIKLLDYCERVFGMGLKEMIKGRVDEVFVDNFIKELEHTDMSHLPPGISEIEVTSFTSMAEETKKSLSAVIDKKTGKKFAAKFAEDPHLMGGVTIKFGSLLLDGSVAGKLKESVTATKKRIEENV